MNATAPTARTASTLTGRRPAAKHPITDDRYRTVGAIVDGTQSTHFGDYAARVGARAAVPMWACSSSGALRTRRRWPRSRLRPSPRTT